MLSATVFVSRPGPHSEGQEGGRVEGVRGLVSAAAAAPVGFGAGLRGGRGALRLQHVWVGEYEAWGIWCGSRGRRRHHWRVQAVSVCTVHPNAATQADGLDDGPLGLAYTILNVIRFLLHYHMVHVAPGAHVGAHGQGEGVALLMLVVH